VDRTRTSQTRHPTHLDSIRLPILIHTVPRKQQLYPDSWVTTADLSRLGTFGQGKSLEEGVRTIHEKRGYQREGRTVVAVDQCSELDDGAISQPMEHVCFQLLLIYECAMHGASILDEQGGFLQRRLADSDNSPRTVVVSKGGVHLGQTSGLAQRAP
jgi:hypothetical protein